MNKSEEIIDSMNLEELKLISDCFSHPKVLEALRIYHKIPGIFKKAFLIGLKSKIKERKRTLKGE